MSPARRGLGEGESVTRFIRLRRIYAPTAHIPFTHVSVLQLREVLILSLMRAWDPSTAVGVTREQCVEIYTPTAYLCALGVFMRLWRTSPLRMK
jgi:hypothetical protein